jgi:flagellar protein FliO/FliZ
VTMPWLIAQAQATAPAATGWSDGPGVVRTLLSLFVVLGLMGGTLWLVRRGGWQAGLRKGPRPVQVETAVGLGDRRQLVIVSVEGRRLLLGVTPMHVSLVTELEGTSFSQALEARVQAEAAGPGGQA